MVKLGFFNKFVDHVQCGIWILIYWIFKIKQSLDIKLCKFKLIYDLVGYFRFYWNFAIYEAPTWLKNPASIVWTHARYKHVCQTHPTFGHVDNNTVHLLGHICHKKLARKEKDGVVSCSDNNVSRKLTVPLISILEYTLWQRHKPLPSETEGWWRWVAGEREWSPEFL